MRCNLSTKRVTSQDVARRAGVSRTTVSLVLNNVAGFQVSEETRQRVIEAASSLGYVPDAAAQALASRRAQMIGLFLSREPHYIASDAYIAQFLDGLIETVRDNGMRVMIDIVKPEHQKEAYLQLVRAKQIDGLILSGPRFDDEALDALDETGFPTVLNGQIPGTKFCSVDVDNRVAAEVAVQHLVGMGHQRIACITNAPVSYTAALDRLRGYRIALEKAGIASDEDLVRYGDFDPQSGYAQMKSLLKVKPRPSAVFVASDVVAVGVMSAIQEEGLRIPGDIALVGFDDVPFARYLQPALTSVHLPAFELARSACLLLLQLIRREQPAERQVLLDTHFVVRKSCGAGENV